MEVNLLFPVRIEAKEGGSHIFFVDCANQRVFHADGSEVGDKLKEVVLNDLWQQRQLLAVTVSTELMQEALNTKKDTRPLQIFIFIPHIFHNRGRYKQSHTSAKTVAWAGQSFVQDHGCHKVLPHVQFLL